MSAFELYAEPAKVPANDADRIAKILGLIGDDPFDDVTLATRISDGLRPAAAKALGDIIGTRQVVGPLIPEATLRRARKSRKLLSREMSERLYEVGRVVDAVSLIYHGDRNLVSRFLNTPHHLLDHKTPLEMAGSSSAGANAVVNLLRRAEAGIAA